MGGPGHGDQLSEVYQDINPSPPGWTERMPLLHLRELLSALANVGQDARIDRIRDILAPFYSR